MSSIPQVFPEIKTFVFLDTETTGLPFEENNKTKITELCLTAVHASHIRLGVFPRVQNKLNLCFNPRKLISEVSEKITGLSNEILEESCIFSKDTVTTINHFLNQVPSPICMVAHNGLRFDYPLLRREVDKTSMSLDEAILCVDTLVAFKQLIIEDNIEINNYSENLDVVDNINQNIMLENEKLLFSREAQIRNEHTPKKQNTSKEHNYSLPKRIKGVPARKMLNFGPSYKLGDVFSRLTKKEPINSHQADGDVTMLIMCAASLGHAFVEWCNSFAGKFCDVPAMVPGKRIGT